MTERDPNTMLGLGLCQHGIKTDCPHCVELAERKQNVHCTCDAGIGKPRHDIWCPVHGRGTTL